MRAIVTAFFGCGMLLCARADPLKLIGAVPLPGASGRFDRFAIDPKRHRLFVTALGNNTLEIIDTSSNQRITSISG